MPTLFPPLEAEGDGESVLPANVKANFEAIQAIIRAQSRLAKEQEVLAGVGTSEGAGRRDENSSAVGRETLVEGQGVGFGGDSQKRGLETRKRKLATATAVAVQSEIARLTNGIAELESLLLQQGNNADVPEIEFPALPTVVADEESEDCQEKKGGSSDEVADSDATKGGMDVLKEREE